MSDDGETSVPRASREGAEAHRDAERLRALSEISRAFGEAGIELSAVLSTVARRTAEVLRGGSVVRLLAEGSGKLDPVALFHIDPEVIPLVREAAAGSPVGPDEELSKQALTTGAALAIDRASMALAHGDGDHERALLLDRFCAECVIVAPLRAPGRALGTLTVFRDRDSLPFSADDLVLAQEVAARASLAIENARLHEETRDAALAREELLEIVSHDLRNPLNVVMMNSAILLRGAGPDKAGEHVKKHAEKILRSAERMRSLIADLLDATRVQSGRIPVDLRPLELAQLVGESLDMFKELAAPKGQRLTRDLESGVPLVLCDRERVLQLLGNLVGNALKFTPDGGVIAVRLAQIEGSALVSVSDTGPGIPDDYIPHIFERYWRGKRDAQAGTGLGLYIAKGIVEAHRGRIWLESRLGQGSTFFFTIPLYREGQPMSPPSGRAPLS